MILTPDDTIDDSEVRACLGGEAPGAATPLFRPGVPFKVLAEEGERAILEQALEHHGGAMAATARALGLERSHLYKKCKALGLRGDKVDDDDA